MPATPSLIEPDNAGSNDPYSPVQHHPATRCDCLIVKQVHREFALGSADLRHRRHRHCRPGRRRDHRNWCPESAARPAAVAGRPSASRRLAQSGSGGGRRPDGYRSRVRGIIRFAQGAQVTSQVIRGGQGVRVVLA